MYATGTTGQILEQELGFAITKLQSGPLGGNQQMEAKIVVDKINFMIFFSDPLEQQAHDPDVKALLRMAVLWNIPIACNRASADFMISSPLMDGEYDRLVPDYEEYRTQKISMSEEVDQGVLYWLVIMVVLSIAASWLPPRSATRISVRKSLAYQ